MKKFIHDVAIPIKASINEDTGFLTAPVTLARTGVQYYLGYELGLTERALDKVGVYRSPEEVFSKASIGSYVNLVVTDDHPADFVTTDNVKDLQMGMVSHVERKGNELAGIITVTDKDQIAKARDGKKEVSLGYSQELKPMVGTHDGEGYEFIQTGIMANHLAIVDKGRCGPNCKLIVDNKGENAVKIDIEGITFDVDNEPLVQAIKKLKDEFEKKLSAEEEKAKKEKEDKEKALKEKDAALALADSLKKEKLTDADIGALVGERAKLLADAVAILGDKMPECVDCPAQIKTLVVEDVLPDMDMKDKSEAYLDAAYDIAIERFKAGKKSTDDLSGDFKKKAKDGEEVTRAGARDKYMKDQLKIV